MPYETVRALNSPPEKRLIRRKGWSNPLIGQAPPFEHFRAAVGTTRLQTSGGAVVFAATTRAGARPPRSAYRRRRGGSSPRAGLSTRGFHAWEFGRAHHPLALPTFDVEAGHVCGVEDARRRR